ncbi:molybdopterin-dependent oxidoreductase [Pelomonas sp. KK5]|uniref:molybdopterin-dependent oxidoreductase n=1 Tax=Pelomonas sp. KK5 TaxID=1855730 RepID=UPI0009F98604|nr:molybdopterin-dependent oxidoreductase [Pelomonas sp. KK5]
METLSHYRICPLCEACCGLEVRTQGDKVIGIRGAGQDVFSHGYICPKGFSLKDLHEDPDRLRTPLIKRDGAFVEASWDEAFAEIERRLVAIREQHGPDALALVLGNPSAHKVGLLAYVPRLIKALGTRNFFSASTLDQMPKQLGAGLMFGHWLSIAVPDIERCDYLLMLGANPMVSNGSLWTVPDYRGKAKAMRERGGRIVVVDPRRTETAAQADEHLAIRPGGDVYLLLGLVHTLFDEGLAKPGRLAEWTNGIEALREAVLPFTPERMVAGCGIDAATQRRLARELADAPRGCVYGRLGTCTQRFGTLNSLLIDALNVLTGKLDAPGGAMFPKAAAFAANTAGAPGSGRGVRTGRHASRVSGAPEVFGELPITLLAEEIETAGAGQVKALIAIAANPVLSTPNGARLSRALEGLDFMVSLDIYLNETSRHADVILPGLSPLEDLHYDVAFPQLSHRNHARFSGPVFAPPAGQPQEWETLLRLAALFDPEAAAMPGPEALIDQALRHGPYGLTLDQVKASDGGIDLGPLQPRIPELLRTPSGRIELAPPQLLAELAHVNEALLTPQPDGMLLIGRRDVRSGNSWMHNLPVLAKGPERCTLLMNPTDAERLGLADGAIARLKAGAAELLAPVALTTDLMSGVVSLPHGWGHDLPGSRLSRAAERPGVNMNALLDDRLRDPLSGNAVLSGVLVEILPSH